jgi:hypothetical protein
LFPRLGIVQAMAPKIQRIDRERVGAVVARGDAEIGVQQISELLEVPGVDLVGPLPDEVQRVTVFSAGVVTATANAEAAQQYIRFFGTSDAARVMRDGGLDPIAPLQRGASDDDARPNFEGTWNSATVTPLERPLELKDKPFFTSEEAAQWERQIAKRNEEPPPGAPRSGTGTYNTFYREYGTRTVRTLRTSIVFDPPDGRIPALTAAAAEIKRQRTERQRAGENPEDLGLQDRCLAFLTAGPPLLPYSYNSNYQIVQTKDALVVHAEMIHDTRIIHLDGRPHLPPTVRTWAGDSIGRWEGNTLEIDTTNFNDAGGFYGDAGGNFGWDRHLHLIERLSLLDPDTLHYQFEIDNPTAFTRPWKGELTMTRSAENLYEFACHEGNYSMTNMLRGYRATEQKRGGAPMQ